MPKNSGMVYFAKRVGWHWQVWHRYADGRVEENGAHEWRSIFGVQFWRRLTAERMVLGFQRAYEDGRLGMRFTYFVDEPINPKRRSADAAPQSDINLQ